MIYIKKCLSTFVLLCTIFSLFGQNEVKTAIDYGNNKAAGNYANINGIKMYYETYGDKTKQPMLLIHGNGGSIWYERFQAEYFKKDYFIIMVDSRYQGKSGHDSRELTYNLMTSDFNALLEYLHIDSTYIIGQSDGAIIGLLLAINYPDKVKKLAATAPNLRPDTTTIYKWDVDLNKKQLADVIRKINNGDTSDSLLQKKTLLNLMDKYPNIKTSELSKIKVPVLMMSSDEDAISIYHIIEMYRAIPNAQLFVMPGATHIMYRAEPELFNTIANRFFSTPFKRPTTKELWMGK